MTIEQERKMLEAAAKACGFKIWRMLSNCLFQVSRATEWDESFIGWTDWNPLTVSSDTADMCAELEIDTVWAEEHVVCHIGSEMLYESIELYEDHDNSRLKAWMCAATMVAAKIGGYEDDI